MEEPPGPLSTSDVTIPPPPWATIVRFKVVMLFTTDLRGEANFASESPSARSGCARCQVASSEDELLRLILARSNAR
jgi:hypothetical protein